MTYILAHPAKRKNVLEYHLPTMKALYHNSLFPWMKFQSGFQKKKKNFYTHFTIKLLKKKKTFSKWPQTNPHFNNILAYIACIGVLVQSNIMLFGRTIDDGCLLHACSWRVDLTGCRYNNLGAIFSVVIAILKIQIYWR